MNKYKYPEYQKQWQRDNADKVKAAGYKYLEGHPEKKLLKSSKANAKAKGLEHNLELEDIIIPDMCPYLNVPLTFKIDSTNTLSTASLDRIDSSKGYVKGNVQVISRLANSMKSNANKEQLITFAQNILKKWS